MRRAAFIWLPHWPTDRRRRRADAPPPERPFALAAPGPGGLRLMAVDAAAAGLGLAPGQLLADARALAPALVCRDADRSADAAALARLARWCGRFSPLVAPAASGADGLYLEVAGVDHLFGGEAGWLEALLGAVRGFGFAAAGALADTPGAAWALARFAPQAATRGGMIVSPGAGLAPLEGLPVAALRLDPAVAEALRAVGLKRVGDLARAPRPGLARRFGPALLGALDAAAGRAPEPIDALHPAPRFVVARRFAEPLLEAPALAAAAENLARRLCLALERAGRGGRRFVLGFERIDGARAELRVGAARPLSDAAVLARLLAGRLEAVAGGLDLGFGVEGACLAALETERRVAVAQPLDPAAGEDPAEAAAGLGDRLAARLGEEALFRLAPAASHLPERAQRRIARAGAPPIEPPPPQAGERPLWLFERPEPIEAVAETPDGPPRRFRWRRTLHRVARAEGPERIAAEWWRAPGPTRDYFRIETEEGRRFWLCREGLYGRETDAPRWFVHGSFP